ncbi:MAG: hypothetical protein SFU99_18625 [Saprospiraceae bacterium]|nr:hypothetical protein [Saprospiraceae bacterium]
MKKVLQFLPLLILYIINIALFSDNEPFRDEARYLMYAQNIANGFYTTTENPYLMNGPGYPIFLSFFMGLNLPLIVPKLVNGVLIFLSVLFFYNTLLCYIPQKKALLFAYIMGLYYPMFRWMILNITESLSFFLLCGFLFYSMKICRMEKPKLWNIILPGLLMGYLLLTKLFFVYVVLLSLIIGIFYYVIFKTKTIGRLSTIMTVGLLCLTPYLIYTYKLTGRSMYLGTNGGEQLYWMTTAHENEYGMWYAISPELKYLVSNLHPNHAEISDLVASKSFVEQNDFITKAALENIKNNPKDYIKNILPNTLRLMFGYPYSYMHQNMSMYYYLMINMPLMLAFALCFFPAYLHRRAIPTEIIGMVLFVMIYFAGCAMLSAVPRYFFMALPFILLWIAFVSTYFVQITFQNKLSDPS